VTCNCSTCEWLLCPGKRRGEKLPTTKAPQRAVGSEATAQKELLECPCAFVALPPQQISALQKSKTRGPVGGGLGGIVGLPATAKHFNRTERSALHYLGGGYRNCLPCKGGRSGLKISTIPDGPRPSSAFEGLIPSLAFLPRYTGVALGHPLRSVGSGTRCSSSFGSE
jgi:hypothetical protein